ncbi:MAG: DnaB helicase C-terminal domain-containing protein [archaeon]|nr:DnaB helicase C-terminal domain-containing protein [archaeon]
MIKITELNLNIPKNYNLYLPKLNDITNGVNEGELVIIAARPGCGKTSLMVHLSAYLQLIDKTEFYSLEMTNSELLLRFKKLFKINKLTNL